MTRPGRRLPKALITALRSHQTLAGKRKPAPEITEWDFDALEHGVGRLVGTRYDRSVPHEIHEPSTVCEHLPGQTRCIGCGMDEPRKG